MKAMGGPCDFKNLTHASTSLEYLPGSSCLISDFRNRKFQEVIPALWKLRTEQKMGFGLQFSFY